MANKNQMRVAKQLNKSYQTGKGNPVDSSRANPARKSGVKNYNRKNNKNRSQEQH